jgi:hypothetical protein
MVSSHGRARFWRGRLRVAALVVLAAAAVTTWRSGPARADGDPASDVLATQSLFLPEDAGVPAGRQDQLVPLLANAQRSGVPLRAAVIASAADLGSVTEFWGRPRLYARFLGQELALVYRGPLIVVMPGGFGLYQPGKPVPGGQSALAALRPARSVPGLGAVTLAAVQRLAAAAGHPLTVPSVSSPTAPGSSDTVSWLVFAAGAILIALAWTFSLRARPLQAWRRTGRAA